MSQSHGTGTVYLCHAYCGGSRTKMREATIHISDEALDAFGIGEFVATARAATIENLTELQCGRPGCLLVLTVAETLPEDRLSSLETVQWWERLRTEAEVTYLCKLTVPVLDDGLEPHYDTEITEDEVAVNDDGIDVTMVGPQGELADRVDAYDESSAGVFLRSLGEYAGPTNPLDGLTSRQQEVLEAAVEHGYFAVPREVTTVELADNLNLAPATVREHLQRVQRNVFTSLLGPQQR